MKDFARNLDDLRRIVIPAEICRQNGIEKGDLLQIKVVPEGILLVPLKARCAMCGSADNLVMVGSNAICMSCATKAKQALESKGKAAL